MSSPPKYAESYRQQAYNPTYNSPIVQGNPAMGYSTIPPTNQVIYLTPQTALPHNTVVLESSNSNYHHHDEYTLHKLSCLRGFQAAVAMTVLALQCSLLACSNDYWFYWIWLLIVPLCSISTHMKYGCSLFKGTVSTDTFGTIAWLLHIGAIAAVYFGFYDFYDESEKTSSIVISCMSVSGFNALLHIYAACVFPSSKRFATYAEI